VVCAALGFAVFSHLLLDLPMHPPDLALWPHTPMQFGFAMASVADWPVVDRTGIHRRRQRVLFGAGEIGKDFWRSRRVGVCHCIAVTSFEFPMALAGEMKAHLRGWQADLIASRGTVAFTSIRE